MRLLVLESQPSVGASIATAEATKTSFAALERLISSEIQDSVLYRPKPKRFVTNTLPSISTGA